MNSYLKFIRNEFPKTVSLGKLNFTEHVRERDCSVTSIQHKKLFLDHKNYQSSVAKDEKTQIKKLDLIEGDNNFVNVSFAIIFFLSNFNILSFQLG